MGNIEPFIRPPRVLVREDKDWSEIIIGFDAANRFVLMDETGAHLGHAAEEAGGFMRMLARNFFGHCRAATIHLYDPEDHEVLRGEKPFTWFFHRMEVYEGSRKIGAIQRKWALLSRIFSVENAAGVEVLRIESKLFRIWTFALVADGQQIGMISKKWGGLLTEMFSDADTFGVEFPPAGMGDEIRKILLAATFLIDFTCFENNRGSGGLLDAFGQ